jgi:DNA-binding CsgD family transcriptional regulator
MRLGADTVEDLVRLTADCRSRAEYEVMRLEWLSQTIGFDASYFGAVTPAQPRTPRTTGVSRDRVAECEAHADRYWQDRLTLTRAAATGRGVVADHDALSYQTRQRMPFYREVVAGHGIRATAIGLLRLRGQVFGCVFLGRVSSGARFGDELELLRRALPALSLGDAVHESEADEHEASSRLASLTSREHDVLSLLCRGCTNAQIAAQLGSSPRTVKNQVSAILNKTRAANRTQLATRMAGLARGRP